MGVQVRRFSPPWSRRQLHCWILHAATIVCQRHRWYHIIMEKTTLYLPEDLKLAVKRAAAERGVSEAEIIRESIRVSVGSVRPRARGALYSSGQPIARDAEELLAGFGER
jgi:hypothetical protein